MSYFLFLETYVHWNNNTAVLEIPDDNLLLPRCLVEIIPPPLHHLPAFRETLRVVVAGADLIALAMSKLAFDNVMAEAVLVQDGARRRPETVAGGAGMVAHAIQREEDGIFGHATGRLVLIRKDESVTQR